MTKKKILVVDDNEIHRQSAVTLEDIGYKVDIMSDFSSATERLGFKYLDPTSHLPATDYFALLTDLNIPLAQGGRSHFGEERALGYGLVFIASRLGIPNIAVLSDSNHHDDSHVAGWDLLYDVDKRGKRKPIFRLNESRLVLLCQDDVRHLVLRKDGKYVPRSEFYDLPQEERPSQFDVKSHSQRYFPKIEAKNWPAALDYLLQEELK